MKNYNIINDCRGMNEDEIIEAILTDREINDAKHFFKPLKSSLIKLNAMENIKEAASIVRKNIDNAENAKIGVLFDTDTDGIMSGTIMTRYLKQFGCTVHTFIDEGKEHGVLADDLYKYEGLDLLIIVDSLNSDEIMYKRLKEEYGVKDIVVLDHHAVDENIPYQKYITLVSSQINYENKSLSGSGVTWKFCKYIDTLYKTDYADELIDLAACGIVADMMDMSVMENRYIVYKGIENTHNPAIKKILSGYEFNSTSISFSIAPLINAANRTNFNVDAMNAFLADENKEVLKYVKVLKNCRELQNEEVNNLMPDIEKQCEEQKSNKMIIVFTNTQYGINGLIANKLLEKYKRPILVLKKDDGEYVGSMRATGVEDFRQMCEDSGYAVAKGHELASGIFIKEDNLDKFISYMNDILPDTIDEEMIIADIRLDISSITRTLVDRIKNIDKVSGTGFSPVKVYIDGITEYEVGNMSNYKHLVLKPEENVWLIKWNWNGDFDEMEDNSLMNESVSVVATLDSGFLARKFILKVICDDIEVAA